ncbi:membrane-bound serine protease (ClpP class) [Mesobacillus foraminis]|uniref:Membrane-bound serine protease (ClpP class) n=2 Tax=Mesobacillus foraminis TaxID=279826 RepID=A0A4R2BCN6_9BACI|nr:membrane-bound serine protease (ClpP class) [Mesobacillus foraminis]
MKLCRMFFLPFLAILFFSAAFPVNGSAEGETVYVVPVEETVEKGLFSFLKRAVSEAEENGAAAIIFEINTPGGAVDAAGEIGKLLTSTDIQTIAFINKQALSAGAYISLNTDEIYMVPGSVMGSAAIIDQNGNTAGKKAESYWFAAMRSAAAESGRDPIYALAMADEEIDLPEYGAGKGELLTLTAEQALEVGYSEGTVKNMHELTEKLGFEQANIRTVDESFAEKAARFITNPVVVPILLTIGSLGLVLELYSPGFGIPGFMGLSSLMLFFYGHLVAGLAGYEAIILFIAGVVLVLLEFFLPGGIAGGIGFIAIVSSLFLASGDAVHMGISLLIAISASIIVSILMVKVLGKRMKLFRKIILKDSTSTDLGYVSNKNRTDLIGLKGVTLTALRPAGTVEVNGERIDVVSEGSFIQKGVKIKIVKTEGSRIVVREEPDQENGGND